MNSIQNPYEVTATQLARSETSTPEWIWRIRFVVSMWVCGVVGIQCIPVYPWTPEHWATNAGAQSNGIHFAWIAPFCCSIASVVCAVCLCRLPKLMDRLGAITCIILVGWWPGYAALYWWLYFATH